LVDAVIALSQSNSIAKSGEIYGNQKTNPQMILLFRVVQVGFMGIAKTHFGNPFQPISRKKGCCIHPAKFGEILAVNDMHTTAANLEMT
jgi:hypothetical protein